MILEMRMDNIYNLMYVIRNRKATPKFPYSTPFALNQRRKLYHGPPICVLPIGSSLPSTRHAVVFARQSDWFAVGCYYATVAPNIWHLLMTLCQFNDGKTNPVQIIKPRFIEKQ